MLIDSAVFCLLEKFHALIRLEVIFFKFKCSSN